jgi:nucleoid-associated protein YgaU
VEPATGYLILVAGTSVVWLAGETTWKCALWVARRPSLRALGAVRVASVVFTVMVAAASWRVAPAVADVVPPSHRVMATGDVSAVQATSTVTFASMLESTGRSVSTYTVRSGDCLWSIARSTIIADGAVPNGASTAELWRRIYDVNADVIGANPGLIFPGQVLEIPER